MGGQLRIIGGDWRGRRLRVAPVPGLRPTGDRTREMLFNWLQARTAGARVLDVFAGTGALGLEALSRGARDALFIEHSRRAAAVLREHIRALGAADRAHLRVADAIRYDVAAEGPFDIIFLDPPFAAGLQAGMLARIAEEAWLAPRGVVYVESEAHADGPAFPPGWQCHRMRAVGEVQAALVGPG